LASASGPSKIKKRIADEELSDATDDDGVDDLDLRVSDEDPYKSASENEDETPAEKRLRLAQLYLDGVRTSLGMYGLSIIYPCPDSENS
jgi:ribosomal RNA-processing protein 9